MSIEVKNVAKTYGSFQAVQNANLEVEKGELIALLGPSGSGKTTLLRLIAGLEGADRGQILFQGEDSTLKSVAERKVGFVFQHYALFRHMNIFDNIAFGLQVRPRKKRPPVTEIKARVHELLQLIQLEGLASRFPSQLSGGQRQRVALARALAVEPDVLLLDEPFGALDAKVRIELRRWLKGLHEKLNITTIFVTHDQEEALEMADRVVIMNNGQIEQMGTPEEVYRSPANPFVYGFLGRVNVFQGRALQVDLQTGVDPQKSGALGYIRPHEIQVSKERNEKTAISSRVRHIYRIGPIIRLELKREDTGDALEAELSARAFDQLQVQVDDTLFVDLGNMKVFVKEEDQKVV